jgi:hypothetical protein
MNWFKKMVVRWVREDWNNSSKNSSSLSSGVQLSVREETSCVESEPVLNFKVYSAVGGRIVEFRKYDRNRDRNEMQTYIITNDQDFGERIAKIATMENLKS